MSERLSSWWFSMRDTLWPIPTAMTTVAVLLALLLVQLDEQVLVDNGEHRWWLFSGGAAGARGVLSTIAGTSMTVATMAFSITIVALQLGSSQFSPRILRGFTGDRGNQVVLGIFVATFAYSLVVLREVRTETDDQRTFVPGTAVTVAILFAFVMVGALIFFFHHATRGIQAPVIIDRAVRDTRGLIEAEISRREAMFLVSNAQSPRAAAGWIDASSAGYVQSIDLGLLAGVARDSGRMIRVVVEEGDFVVPGSMLAAAWPVGPEDGPHDAVDATESWMGAVRSAFLLGMEPTLEHDIDLGFRQVSDIALKGLSPGINDPTTAIACIDRLAELLELTLGMRSATYAIRDDDGQIRVSIDFSGFDVYLGVAFDQIRHYGAGDATVMLHLLEALNVLSCMAGDPDNRRHLAVMAERAIEETEALALPSADRARLLMAASWAMHTAA